MKEVSIIKVNISDFQSADELEIFMRKQSRLSNFPTVFRLPDTLDLAVMVYPDHDTYVTVRGFEGWKPVEFRWGVNALMAWGL